MHDSGLTVGREEKPVHSGADGTVAMGSRELIPLLTGNCWSVIPSWLSLCTPNSDPKGYFAIVHRRISTHANTPHSIGKQDSRAGAATTNQAAPGRSDIARWEVMHAHTAFVTLPDQFPQTMMVIW